MTRIAKIPVRASLILTTCFCHLFAFSVGSFLLTLVASSAATAAAAPLAGAPLAGVPLAGAPLAGVPLAGAPLAGVPLAGVQTDSEPDVDLEGLRQRVLAEDATQRNIAADDLVRANDVAADGIIRELLTGPINNGHARGIVSLLEVIRVRGIPRFLPEVLDLARRANGNSNSALIKETARATVLGMKGNARADAELIRIFESSDDLDVRLQAVDFLRQLASIECLDLFIKIGSSAENQSQRMQIALVDALEAITGQRYGTDWAQWSDWAGRILVRDKQGVLDTDRVWTHINDTLRTRVTEVDRELVSWTEKYLDARAASDDTAGYRAELLQLLENDAHDVIRADAARRLGDLKADKVVLSDGVALRAALGDPATMVRVAVLRSLGKLASKKSDAADWAELIEQIRGDVLAAMSSDFPAIKNAAIVAAGRVGGKEIDRFLTKELLSLSGNKWPDPGTRGAIIEALGRKGVGAPNLIAGLGKVLASDPAWANRKRAAATLGLIGNPDAVEYLGAALLNANETNDDVRWKAADSLGSIGGAEAIDPLIKGLNDSVEGIRTVCVRNLGKIGNQKSVAPLAELLARDTSASVRLNVAQALGELGDPSAIPALLATLTDDDVNVSTAVRKALTRIWGDNADLLVTGGIHVVDLDLPALAPFAIATLRKAETLLQETPPDNPVKVRAQIARGRAHLLASQAEAAESVFNPLRPMRDKISKADYADVLIGFARCTAGRRPFQAANGLRAELSGPKVVYAVTSPEYWKIVAATTELLLAAAETKEGDARYPTYTDAKAVLEARPRPEGLDAQLVDRLDRLAADVDRRLAASPTPEPTEPAASSAETDIQALFLYFESGATNRDPAEFEANTKKLTAYPLDARVRVAFNMMASDTLNMRQVGIKSLQKLFADQSFDFDPDAGDTTRTPQLATIEAWWADQASTNGDTKPGGTE